MRLSAMEALGKAPRVLGVTSCGQGAGCTTFAEGLGRLVAAEGKRVLLVDASTGNPELSMHFAPRNTEGVRQVLRGEAEFADVLHREVAPCLDFVPLGADRGGGEAIWSELSRMLKGNPVSYAWVIIDMGPILPGAMARSCGAALDGLFIIVADGKTKEKTLENCLDALGPVRSKLLGIVLNSAASRKAGWRGSAMPRQASAAPPPARCLVCQSGRAPSSRSGRMLNRKIVFAAGLAGCLCLGLCLPGAAAGYQLGISDRIKIKVQEWPDLTGEYAVNPEGMISLPLLGEVQASGRQAGDVGAEISARLQQRNSTSERPFAAVEIVSFRPFFILGDVDHPGQYPYRPGMTVLQAIGMAGGFYRQPNPGLMRLDRDIALAEGESRTLSIRLIRLRARAARLEATAGEAKAIQFPPEILDQKDRPGVAGLLADERATFELDQTTVAQEKQAMANIRDLYQQEIVTMRGQITTLTQEKERTERQLQELRALSAKGLGLAPTQQALERSIAQISNEQLSMQTAIVRAQESIALAEQKLPELAVSRKRASIRALGDTRDEIRDVQARLVTAQELLSEARYSAPRQAREQAVAGVGGEPIMLVRQIADGVREIIASEATQIEPEDVIKVPRSLARVRVQAEAER